VDWFLDSTRAADVTALRHEIGAYLTRHAADPAGVEEAELVVAELLGNANRHAAGPSWVSLIWSTAHPVLTVYDLGPGFVLEPHLPPEPTDAGGRGLFIASQLTGQLSAAARRAGGTEISAELPVGRAESPSYHPSVSALGSLPGLDEAIPGTGFGKEAFLRALVVQLAQEIERTAGPAAAEATVAQVGTDVGAQMEEEFRAARGVVGKMSAGELGECFVRLKHAIDGEFSVLEATPQRIVLINTACPFGEVVRGAPALCRMTSSVFGGIAARNAEREASVVLEERIAVGDSGCRVVVYLDVPPEDPGVAHHYPHPAEG